MEIPFTPEEEKSMGDKSKSNPRIYLLIGLGLVLGVLLLATANVDTLSGMASGRSAYGISFNESEKSWLLINQMHAYSLGTK